MRGLVKWFSGQKGYGFIRPADGSKDVFVHISALSKSGLSDLGEGVPVEFDIEPGKKGDQATNIKIVS